MMRNASATLSISALLAKMAIRDADTRNSLRKTVAEDIVSALVFIIISDLALSFWAAGR